MAGGSNNREEEEEEGDVEGGFQAERARPISYLSIKNMPIPMQMVTSQLYIFKFTDVGRNGKDHHLHLIFVEFD